MYHIKVILLLRGVLTLLKNFITELEGGAAAPGPPYGYRSLCESNEIEVRLSDRETLR